MQPGLMPGARMAKGDVNYRQRQECGQCDHYYSSGSCDLVEGNISPNNVCDKWEIRSNSPYKDKAFFEKEFQKASK